MTPEEWLADYLDPLHEGTVPWKPNGVAIAVLAALRSMPSDLLVEALEGRLVIIEGPFGTRPYYRITEPEEKS